jgi:hypothetical protein
MTGKRREALLDEVTRGGFGRVIAEDPLDGVVKTDRSPLRLELRVTVTVTVMTRRVIL